MQLHYRSDRVTGRKAAYDLTIPLSRRSVPPSLQRIDLVVDIAGRRFEQQFPCPCAPNSEHMFSWDGKDTFGRTLEGAQPVTVSIGYVYQAIYMAPAQRENAFAAFSGTPISGSRTRKEIGLCKVWHGSLGTLTARSQGLGGWTLSDHHAYDPIGRVLHLGDGRRRRADALGGALSTVAGEGCANCVMRDGVPASQTSLYAPSGVAAAPDGSVYIADTFHQRIRRVDPDGVITTVAGMGNAGGRGDGGPALAAELNGPRGIALGPDGSLYIAEQAGNRIRRLAPNGTISTAAGTGAAAYSGDGGPANLATLRQPFSVAVGLDGTVYIADTGNSRVRSVGPDGVISTVAGTGVAGFSGDGGPADAVQLRWPDGVAVEHDGSVVVADTENNRLRRIDTRGVIRTIAGIDVPGTAGDGEMAHRAELHRPVAVTAGPDGSLYVADSHGYRIRRIGVDGVITSVAGADSSTPLDIQEGQPAAGAALGLVGQLQLGPDGGLYLAEMVDGAIRSSRGAPSRTTRSAACSPRRGPTGKRRSSDGTRLATGSPSRPRGGQPIGSG